MFTKEELQYQIKDLANETFDSLMMMIGTFENQGTLINILNTVAKIVAKNDAIIEGNYAEEIDAIRELSMPL